jgi:small GTP-binding protein
MRLPRLIAFAAGLLAILASSIWLIDSLQRLLWQVSLYSPLLSQVLLLLLIALIAGLIAALVYYLFILPRRAEQRKRRRRQPPQLPTDKVEVAGETLKAVRKQVAQIQDEVARRELLLRSRQIEQNLSRGDIQVVVFGTGSAGKTSLVNAVIGQVVGKVGATMGTTEAGQTYVLQLKGMNRDIHIIDTPGILEAGVVGTEREQLARKLATEADLLLFVLDNDLRRSEYEPLAALTEIGKRSLIILNKADLYLDEDREAILARLRQRLRGLVAPTDIIAVSANPEVVHLEDGSLLQPDPEIIPLLQRMAEVLRAEGEVLVADNILLQSQRLADETRAVIDRERRRQADQIVNRFQWIGAGVIAATPLPLVDMLGAAAVNAQMVVEIGRVYGCEIDLERGRELAFSLSKTMAGLGIIKGAIALVTTALELSLGGIIIGRAIQAVAAAYLTRIAGKSFIEYFRQDQDWGDGGITEVVQRQFQLNRKDEFIKAFVQEAITRVVKPLHLDELTPQQVAQEEAELESLEQTLSDRNPVSLRMPLPSLTQPEREPELMELPVAEDEWERPQTFRDDWEDDDRRYVD